MALTSKIMASRVIVAAVFFPNKSHFFFPQSVEIPFYHARVIYQKLIGTSCLAKLTYLW